MEWLLSQLDARSVTAAVAAVVGMIYASSDGRLKMVAGWLKKLLPKSAPATIDKPLDVRPEIRDAGVIVIELDPEREFMRAMQDLHRLAHDADEHKRLGQYTADWWAARAGKSAPKSPATSETVSDLVR